MEIIMNQITAISANYTPGTFFSNEDIFEPIYTQISHEEFQTGIRILLKASKIEVTEIGIRLGSK